MKNSLVFLLALLLLPALAAVATGGGEEEDTGAAAAVSGTYTQSPFLDARVASGELPPVDQRLPKEPWVRQVLDEIGTYGGRLTIFSHEHPSPYAPLVGENRQGAPKFVFMNLDGSLEPGLAKGWDIPDDYMSFTLYLREGAKWSNGDPLTAEDFTFMYYELQQKGLGTVWSSPSQLTSVTAVDDYTVRWDYSEPFPKSILKMTIHSDWDLYAASTWLKQWHIDYNDDAADLAKEEGYDSWQDALTDHNRFFPQSDITKPTMFPFMLTEFTGSFRTKERNPYYVGVDTAGQQLPYIDTALIQKVDAETVILKTIAGEADYDTLTLDQYPLLVQGAEAGNYKVHLYENWFEGSGLAYMFNLSSPDPAKKELFDSVEFRRAMSLAIDRDRINDVGWFGQGTPSARTVSKLASIYKPEWGEDHPYARHDPDEANRMLDALGLEARDAEGIRLLPDGRPFRILFAYGGTKPARYHELVAEDFEAVGVGVDLRSSASVDIVEGMHDGTIDFIQWNEVIGELYDWLPGREDDWGGINQSFSHTAYDYWNWWIEMNDRRTGVSDETGDLPGEEPPAALQEYFQAQIVESKKYPYSSAEQQRWSSRAWELLAENLWNIGVTQAAPLALVYRTSLMNVPLTLPPNAEGDVIFNNFTDQLFFKN